MNKLFLALCFLTATAFLYAQTGADVQWASHSPQSAAEEIEMLLNTSAVTYAQAARFLLEASDAMVTSDPEEAFRYAAARDWLPKKVSANEAARLDCVSLLLMRSFDIKGGILYSITKSPHYAYRELEYRDTIQGRSDPGMNVSGERLLFITGRILSQFGDVAALAAGEESAGIVPKDAEMEAAAEAVARREELAAEINVLIEEQNVADTVAEVTDEGIMIRLSNIQFLGDSAQLQESERVKIQEIANILKAIPGTRIQVAGHTALAGTQEVRLRISLDRARAVASYLVLLGARKESEITAVGYGAEYPIADNSTEEGLAANRRVEITILED